MKQKGRFNMSDMNYWRVCDQVKCANCGTLVPIESVYPTEIGCLCFDCYKSNWPVGMENLEFSHAVIESSKASFTIHMEDKLSHCMIS